MMSGIECSCACDVDDGEPIMPFNERFPVARKAHTCCECGEPIKPRQQYQYVWGISYGEAVTFKTCMSCYRIRRDYGCRIFGELAENVRECLGVEL